MKLKSRIFGVSAGVMLAVSMTVAPAFAAAPVVTAPDTAFDQGTMSSRGECSTIAVGTILTADKLFGLGLTNRAVTSSSKGYPRDAADASAGLVGSCSIQQRLGVSGASVPYLGNQWVAKSVTKFGTKLSGITDCMPAGQDTDAADERSLSGKLGVSYSDGSKTDAYVRVQGFDTAAPDAVWLTGIVTKGEAVGASIGGSIWFNPATKIKGATYYGDAIVDDIKTVGFDESTFTSIAPGYATSAAFTTSEAIACQIGNEDAFPLGTGYGVPGLDLIGIGGGADHPSVALGTVTTGIRFLL